MATHQKRGRLAQGLTEVVDANLWLEADKRSPLVSYWLVERNCWWIQSRHSATSSYLRDLKSVRKVSFAVIGAHMATWVFEGTERKLRAILQGLDRELSTLFASHGIQAQAPRAVLLP
jgi:hypothetical protein